MNLEFLAAIAYLTCGALMMFLGFVVLRENPRQRVNLATAAMLMFGALGPILGAFGNLGPTAADDPASYDAFARFAFLWEFFFPAVVLFALVFPTPNPILRRWPRLDVLLFVPHAFHVILVMVAPDSRALLDQLDSAGWLSSAAGLAKVAVDLLLRIHVRFFSFVNLAMVATSMALLMRSARKTTNPKLRSQIGTIRYGLVFGLMLYTGGELIPNAFGIPMTRSVSLPLITVSLLVGAASIVVAIVRLGFLDVRFIVRRGLVYAATSGVIVALYLLLGQQIDRVSTGFVGQNLPVFEAAFLILSLFLLQPLLAGIERFVDRAHSRDGSDLHSALTRLSSEVALLLDPGEVATTVAGSIRREMVLEGAAVVWRDPVADAYTLVAAGETLTTETRWAPGRVLFEALAGRREAVRVAEVLEAPRLREDRELLEPAIRRLDVRVAFPLVTGTVGSESDMEVVGVLLLGPKVTRTRITFEESSLISFVARQVGTSLVNGLLHKERVESRLLQEEVATARRIQQQLLPETPPAIPGWEVAASNSPSRHVGGDYHDFLPLPDGELGFAIGDVSGKGVPAALLMSNLQAALRVRTLGDHAIADVVQDVNRTICRNTGAESFISFFLGGLHPTRGTFRFTNAGHNAPLLVRRDGSVEMLEDGGLLLGVFPEATYESSQVELHRGDLLVLYTDGVTEASNAAGDMYSEERLVESLVKWRDHDVRSVHRLLLDEVRTFQNGLPPDDDLTLVMLKCTGNGASAPESVEAAEGDGALPA